MKKLLLSFVLALAVIAATGQTYDKVSCGAEFSFVHTTTNKLMAWGSNDSGQLGLGNTTEAATPQEVPGSWIAVFASSFHTLALAPDSTLWGTGANDHGQLGFNSGEFSIDTFHQFSSTQKFKSMSANHRFTIAVGADGTLWGTGNNDVGQIGDGTTMNEYDTLIQIGTDADWVAVSCGFAYTIALKSDSTLWGWGNNSYGHVGLGHNNPALIPTQVSTEKWRMIATGAEHSVALRNDGTIWSWGMNATGELGRPTLPSLLSNAPGQMGTDDDWKFISCGTSWTFAIKNDGTLWGCGSNAHGAHGAGTAMQIDVLTQIGTDNDWVNVDGSSGGFSNMMYFSTHSAGLKGNCDEICTTGSNYAYQLGNGTSSTTNQDHFACGIAVNEVPVVQQEQLHLYPNPADDVVYVQHASQQMNVVITDVSGKMLLNSVLSDDAIDVSHFTAGSYFILLTGSDGSVLRERFVKR